jgi:hypothetical protein
VAGGIRLLAMAPHGQDLLQKLQRIERVPQGALFRITGRYSKALSPLNRVREKGLPTALYQSLPRAGSGIDVGRIEAPTRSSLKCPAYR